ncbi:SDR family NAD(P)-dependent oxidoreductase [Pseudovibrio denitrificans]|uniref:SDR family NAD(P)-dependent oxidoreductase n=1 Tax=Pseudovibrio denitrificans TaxID=258256 RepID=UPI0039BEE8F5
MMQMDNNWVLVTGASRGIGAGSAEALAEAGFNLVLWGRTTDDLNATAERCSAKGVNVRVASLDVSDSDAVFDAGAKSLAGLEELRGVFLNAGMGIWGSVHELSISDWREQLATNLDGTFYTLKLTLPYLCRNPTAQILLMGSDSSEIGLPERSAYCASKWGNSGLLEAVRREVRSAGVRVTNLKVSRVDTYFRGKSPNMRPEALHISDVAGLVTTIFQLPPKLEIRELSASANTTTFGIYPEKFQGA